MCGVEVLLCLACGAGAGGVAAWKAKGAMTHQGKVVIDQQGRIMGKDGKLLKDKNGNFVYINDKENKKRGSKMADSGETVSKKGAGEKKGGLFKKQMKDPNRIPVTKRNVAKNTSGDWSNDELAAWQQSKDK